MREFGKRILWSLLLLPVTAGGSFAIQKILAAWGIIDPFARIVGEWLKMNVTSTVHWSPEIVLWSVAFIIFIILYSGALSLIWRQGGQPGSSISEYASIASSTFAHIEPPHQLNQNVAAQNRIPIVRLREMAAAVGWNVDRHTSNDGFNLTNKLNQAAADGALQFWGRKYEYEFGEDAADSVPLVRISQKHFLDYRFESTNLFGDASNFYIFTGRLGNQPSQLKGWIYRDIHVDRKQIEAWLPAR